MKRWPRVTLVELEWIIQNVDRLSRPAKVMPPIVPGQQSSRDIRSSAARM